MTKKDVQMAEEGQESNRVAVVTVSSDGGDTWFRRRINFGGDLGESGLRLGELFRMNDDTYEVMTRDGELQVKKQGRVGGRKRGM